MNLPQFFQLFAVAIILVTSDALDVEENACVLSKQIPTSDNGPGKKKLNRTFIKITKYRYRYFRLRICIHSKSRISIFKIGLLFISIRLIFWCSKKQTTIYFTTEICAQKPNEHYMAGGSACQTCCTDPEAPCRIYTFAPVNACYCVEGTARLQSGKCVPVDSRKCRNERLPKSDCGCNC